MALFALQFSKILRGSMPPDPPREVPSSAVALSVPEKNPTFSQNLNGSTGAELRVLSDYIASKNKARLRITAGNKLFSLKRWALLP